MIPSEVEDQIVRYFFQRYCPDNIMLELEEKLLLFYLEDECFWQVGNVRNGS